MSKYKNLIDDVQVRYISSIGGDNMGQGFHVNLKISPKTNEREKFNEIARKIYYIHNRNMHSWRADVNGLTNDPENGKLNLKILNLHEKFSDHFTSEQSSKDDKEFYKNLDDFGFGKVASNFFNISIDENDLVGKSDQEILKLQKDKIDAFNNLPKEERINMLDKFFDSVEEKAKKDSEKDLEKDLESLKKYEGIVKAILHVFLTIFSSNYRNRKERFVNGLVENSINELSKGDGVVYPFDFLPSIVQGNCSSDHSKNIEIFKKLENCSSITKNMILTEVHDEICKNKKSI